MQRLEGWKQDRQDAKDGKGPINGQTKGGQWEDNEKKEIDDRPRPRGEGQTKAWLGWMERVTKEGTKEGKGPGRSVG